MTDFTSFSLPPQLMAALELMNYQTPTPIQAQAIPLAMQGRDILGSAQTGTGKTAAFAIPMITRLTASPRGSALVLAPTRELAQQIYEVVKQLLRKTRFIHAALVIGGDSMPGQIAQLRTRPRIIIGTPGRINDHLERGTLMLGDTGFLVLDETDRMLDMGFGIQIDRILKFVPAGRQTLMFSATLPKEIIAMSARYLREPERIAVGETNKVAVRVTQEIVHVADDHSKYDELVRQLRAREGSVIVFVKTKRGADRLAQRLNKDRLHATALHGDLHQRQRERVVQSFRDKKFRILAATDVAARGLDIPHIEHVINFDLPMAPEDYIHRIGRTARAGADGAALCLITPADHEKWIDIHKLLYPGEKRPDLPNAERAPRPAGRQERGRGRSQPPRRASAPARPPRAGSGQTDGAHLATMFGAAAPAPAAAGEGDGEAAPRKRRRRRRGKFGATPQPA